jgi:glycine cleavage system H lipoate-binding protein
MKTFVDGSIWTETDARGVSLIGFRQEYIDQVLGECFHVVQADTRRARKGCPLMVLETNDGTNRVRSPVTGTILTFSDKARNFPDRLTEDDVIVEVLPEGTVLPTTKKAREERASVVINDAAGVARHLNVDLFARAAQARNWFDMDVPQGGQVQAAPQQVIIDDQEAIRRRLIEQERQRVLEVQARNRMAANRARGRAR